MKQIIKTIIKGLLPKQKLSYLQRVKYLSIKNRKSYFYTLSHTQILSSNDSVSPIRNMVNQSVKAFEVMNVNYESFYIYPYDPLTIISIPKGCKMIASITVNYSTVINTSLKKLEKEITLCCNKEFSSNELEIIRAIRNLNERIILGLKKRKDDRGKKLLEYHTRMLDNHPQSFDEAIAKILFYNALFWQSYHFHNGLGRLDLILYPFYIKDIEMKVETRESIKCIINHFISILGRDLNAKSMGLIGDTGQYILLGGIDKEGNTIQNTLTEIFLEVFTEAKIPDPKLILRINKDTNNLIWTKAVQCIISGCGSPLLMNEKLIMDGMIDFGYDKKDVWNLGTSACWEPLIIGKSFDQNNPLKNIPVIEAVNETVLGNQDYNTFNAFIENVKQIISTKIKATIHDLEFCPSPLYTLFFDDCITNELDFSQGGAKYNHHGIQICSFPNMINALLNIKRYVYEDKILTLDICKSAISSNFKEHEDIRKLLLSNSLKYGYTNAIVIDLTNQMMQFISEEVNKYTINGQKIKVGFSSSEYINSSKKIKASMDGRYDFTPFAVHISPQSSKIDIQEIIDFAGSLDYSGNRMNGNVVDFILPTSFINEKEKLITILKSAMTSGVYELQLNVLDVQTLKDAKLHPEKYPNLVVRVWGFSAYFNDLPEEYKDNLIKRAEDYAA